MSKAALTARYRPQTFAELAGQDTLKAILSRAAAEDRVAPAYLFSGTRGVGKTTVARIFAKALNCRRAPVGEPCNQCDQCRAITQGMAVDVLEIDGASNRGIDDVRRLKESVGYAPLEGRYKIFIIDEAHMLSREAFNALLKTLEEPPARVTFILATTEPHKFPVTIVSRCQHYVFKGLTQEELEKHLAGVLARENLSYDQAAVSLLARRAAGSVRDSMSLLGQVLALGGERLSEADVRSVLGLAGQEVFQRLLSMVRNGSTLGLSMLVREVLDQGVDLGFFLRELTATWRNLFILRQVGEKALPVVNLPPEEAAALLEEAGKFDLAHIHAAWQMVIEGQRRVLNSLEPALALELLLLNLALLPRLVSLDQFAAQKKNAERAAPAVTMRQPEGASGEEIPAHAGRTPEEDFSQTAPANAAERSERASEPVAQRPAVQAARPETVKEAEPEQPEKKNDGRTDATAGAEAGPKRNQPAASPGDWVEFIKFCNESGMESPILRVTLRKVAAVWEDEKITVLPDSDFSATQLTENLAEFKTLLRRFCGYDPKVDIRDPAKRKTRQELREEIENSPEISLLAEVFDARLTDFDFRQK